MQKCFEIKMEGRLDRLKGKKERMKSSEGIFT